MMIFAFEISDSISHEFWKFFDKQFFGKQFLGNCLAHWNFFVARYPLCMPQYLRPQKFEEFTKIFLRL